MPRPGNGDAEATLEVEGLRYSYRRGREALSGLTLRIARDEQIVGLFGPNGAGKTTLMRVIAGMIQRYHGTVRVGGSSRVAFLPHARLFDSFLTVSQALELVGALDITCDVDLARRQLKQIDLDVNARIGDLSSGMNEKLAIVSTLARRADLYLLDEPLAAVDPLMRSELIDIIRLDRGQPESVVLVSTHIIAGLSKLFTDMVIVNHGRVVSHQPVTLSGEALEEQVKAVLSE